MNIDGIHNRFHNLAFAIDNQQTIEPLMGVSHYSVSY